jgi:hypothetical protein
VINGYQSVRSRAAPEMKAVAGRTYARLKSVERGERKGGLSLRPMRHGLAIVGVLLMLAGGLSDGALGAVVHPAALLWLALIYRDTHHYPPLSATARGRI